MKVFVLGEPDSGKSQLAEEITLDLSENGGKRIYIATMIPFGETGARKVEKHRKNREGKGFITIECPVGVDKAADMEDDIENATCLLECMSNLVGNEMHAEKNEGLFESDLAALITDEVKRLSEKCKNLVIVSNVFPEDAEGYDEDTRRYTRLTGEVNRQIRDISDVFYLFEKGEWKKVELS